MFNGMTVLAYYFFQHLHHTHFYIIISLHIYYYYYYYYYYCLHVSMSRHPRCGTCRRLISKALILVMNNTIQSAGMLYQTTESHLTFPSIVLGNS